MPIEALPHWDLANVYPGLESEELLGDIDRIGAQLDVLDEYLSTHLLPTEEQDETSPSQLARIIAGYLDRMNALLSSYATMRAYLHAFVATDSYNTMARHLMSETEPLGVRLQRQEVVFRGWLGRVAEDESILLQVLAQEGAVRDHGFYLRETIDQSRYLMSEAEETLASELALSGSRAWQKLQGVVASQLKVAFEIDDRTEQLPITIVQNLRTDPDEAVRRRAYETELAAWEQVREPLAACLNGVKGAQDTLNRRRGRIDALHEPLDQARIERDTLDAMLGAMHASFPTFRRYWQAKALRLGKEQLPWWDLFAPLGKAESRYTFSEAQGFVVEHFAGFSERLAAYAQRAFDSCWIDAEPRDGKRGGAFCMRIPAVEESRIFCNYDGSLDQVLTLAHELGHGYHNECQAGLKLLQRGTPMTLAETASIFCQTIITEAALDQATDADEQLAILETTLIDSAQVVVDIYSRYLFEMEISDRRAEAELAADDFCEIMLRAQQETYGDGLDARYLHPYMWASKPHYYISDLAFYNFPYAFGLLFGLGLYVIYQERGVAFLSEYDELLRNTGAGTAAELAAQFGLDIRQQGFWEASLRIIEEQIERYLAL